MNLNDLHFKKLIEYKKAIDENYDSVRNRRAIKHANLKEDLLEITKYSVKVELDWIINIEESLDFIFKAIDEQRQFIRVEGEVVRIEKVKKTSKESVEHLSKHSDLITKIPKPGETIIPDKLYVVEKLNDYAVYENRFLHMVLSYLRIFIYQRLSVIKDKLTTYKANLYLNKNIKQSNKNTLYKLEYDNIVKNDEYLLKKYMNDSVMKRIENIYYNVDLMLQTPLMKEVGKTPPVKPPIVKTNVLRMNQNFKVALALYEYVSAYQKKGYEITEDIKKYSPLENQFSDDLALSIEQQSFITYVYGNGIYDDLSNKYKENLLIEKAKEEESKKFELSLLEKRVKKLKTDYETYILLLEKRNKELETENNKVEIIKQENLMYYKKIEELNLDISSKKNQIDDLESKIKSVELESIKSKIYFTKALEKQEQDYRINIRNLIQEYENEIEKIKVQHAEEILSLKEKHELEINRLIIKHRDEIQSIRTEYEEIIEGKDLLIIDLHNKLNDSKKELEEQKANYEEIIEELDFEHKENIDKLNFEIDDLIEENRVWFSTYHSLKEKHGLIEEYNEYTSKDKFAELTLVKKHFDIFYKKQWKETKGSIRKIVKKESDEILEKDNKKEKDN